METISKGVWFFALCTIAISCDENTDLELEIDPFIEETREIVKLYCKWSERLLVQDYEGALNLVVPGSNGEGATKVAKESWDLGYQDYIIFTYIDMMLVKKM